MKYFILIIFLLSASAVEVFAHKPSNKRPITTESKRQALTRRGTPCDAATKQIDMDVNNVRARLLNGGDCWWDLNKGRYIVPKVEPGSGKKEVSGLFAGAVWVGGLDPANNLHIMAQDYRNSTSTDCWPGPLTPDLGETDKADCINWDQFFVVSGKSIREQQKLWKAKGGTGPLTQEEIPEDVLFYPARGNKYFSSKYNFELPFLPQGLGLFYEEPNSPSDNNVYEPELGDFPIIDIRGCNEPVFPDQMFFWIYNDNGGVHSNSNGDPIRMEVQVQAFAFNTGDEINDMTFQRYKLINRAPQDLVGCYFAMWVDPDLGCYIDDYIGCNIERSLMYIYNRDATDGSNGSNCDQGVETYGTDIPILGVDYFRGPIIPKDTIINGDTTRVYIEGGMSSFMYYNNNIGNPPAGTTDPGNSVEYYRYLRGIWRDGTPLTGHGLGYNPGSVDSTRYAFGGDPNDPAGWSMCSAQAPDGDRRTLQATGPMLLTPGAINELIIGVVYVPDQNYPCPDPDELFAADKLAQDLFDNCFKIKDGPDAPDVDIIELDQELILVLTNDISSNNYNEKYAEAGIGLPAGIDSIYRFEGYRIFQVSDATVTINDQSIADPTKVREIYTVDLKNKISKVYNWVGIKNPSPDPLTHPIVYVPVEKVAGPNQGILHTFPVTEDQFAKGDRRLINHKKYYFVVLAYGYNNFKNFNIVENQGQRNQYCPGRLNIGPNADGRPYTGIPRPQVYEKLNSKYGNGVEITRHDGIGMGGVDLLLKPEMYEKMLAPNFDGKIDYQAGRGPVSVKVYDPLRVKDGDYELRFTDSNLNNTKLDDPVNWVLTNLTTNDTIRSEFSLGRFNEQILNKFGISVLIGQSGEAGGDSTGSCGVIGDGLYYDYKDLNSPPWFIGQPDQNITGVNDFILTSLGQGLYILDPQECFSHLGCGLYDGTWYPFKLTTDTANLTPAWIDPLWKAVAKAKESMAELNNVDIIFTKDKSKWSRCLILETWNPNVGGSLTSPVSKVKNFAIKPNPSVTKYDNDGDGKADVDTQEDSTGYGWFPGYAVDVESGKRLNILFGENSFYSYDNGLLTECAGDTVLTGNDMMYNPVNLPLNPGDPPQFSYFFTNPLCPVSTSNFNILLGSHHYIYVTKTPYDSCRSFRARLNSTKIADKNLLFQNFTWCTMSAMLPGMKLTPLTSGPEGLIPNDLTVRLRVDNPYKYAVGTNENKGHNLYTFKVIGQQAVAAIDKKDFEDALEDVNVVPNPYYGFSNYETGQFSNVVKISNLPASCTVTIYSMDGKFIKQYKRDETPIKRTGSNPGALDKQITPDLEWDLTNFKGIPVSSGAYIIHIKENNTNAEKIIKWFGVARKFDPSGL
jgi:hypothetical protein